MDWLPSNSTAFHEISAQFVFAILYYHLSSSSHLMTLAWVMTINYLLTQNNPLYNKTPSYEQDKIGADIILRSDLTHHLQGIS